MGERQDDWQEEAFWAAQGTNWERRLRRQGGKADGKIIPSLRTACLILRHAEAWAGVIAGDEFAQRVLKMRPPPFEGGCAGEWSDVDAIAARVHIDERWGVDLPGQTLQEAVQLVAERNPFHPVREYLDSLTWDGKPRCEGWLARYLGASSNRAYLVNVGPRWLISAVARIYAPGCQVDTVLVLEGPQGIGKSSALRILGGDWFTDAHIDFRDKDGALVLRGAWIVEFAEFESFKKSTAEMAKAFISRQEDRLRPPYGRAVVSFPRQCVFAATTNPSEYLRDTTGNRRYWPVRCGQADLEALARDRDQIWAEALHFYRKGYRWWLDPAGDDLAEAEQAERLYIEEPWEPLVLKWLHDHQQVEYATVANILEGAIGLDASRQTPRDAQRVGKIVVKTDWSKDRRTIDGDRPWVYVPPRVD